MARLSSDSSERAGQQMPSGYAVSCKRSGGLQEQNQRLLKKAAAHPLEAVGQNSSVEGGVDFIHGEAPQLGFGVGPVKVARKEGILHLRLLLAEAV